MYSIFIGSLLISLLHAVIPNHWLPTLAIGKKEGWSLAETTRVTFIAGMAHVVSTVIIDVLLAMIGSELTTHIEDFTKIIGPSILILIGLYFVEQHYTHHHFHLEKKQIEKKSKGAIIMALAIATFLSPSGDKQSVVDEVAKKIGIDEAYGDLLPGGKVEKVQKLKDEGRHIAFVGDGVNDAPVVALADAGIAMGGLGSDATIETADVVIQNDQPHKIVSAIEIGKITRNIVWQNIILAMTVKVFVLILGAGGVATLWEAVIADVGVALLAILNAVRIQRMQF